MYEGRNVAERRIEETNIEEVVNLIVGRKFTARSARRRRSGAGRMSAGTRQPRGSGRRQRACGRRRCGTVSWPMAPSPRIAIFFLVVCLLFSARHRRLPDGANILNILRQSAPLLIVAAAMTFVITTGGIDLSVGSVLALVSALSADPAAGGRAWPLVVVAMLLLGAPIGALPGLLHRL